MKLSCIVFTLLLTNAVLAQESTPTLKTILLAQLKSTHANTDWFVSANVAVDGLTSEQANWTDGKGNHSVAQLTTHLTFWNETQLAEFTGKTPPTFSGKNDDTFSKPGAWQEAVKKLDDIMTNWEKAIEAADEKKLSQWYSPISKMAAHNAYHVGQMVVMRKAQGVWDAEKGVK